MSLTKPVKVGLSVAAIVMVVAAAAFLIGPKPDKTATTSAAITSDARVATSEATTVEILDPLHERPFKVSTWPTAGDDKQTLVVISHGFSGDRTSQDNLALQLVAAGYTVAAPTHPDLAGLETEDPRLDPLVLRPRHLSLTIDHMSSEATKPFNKVVVIGHSLGGYSALRLAAANPSAAGLEQHCADAPADTVLCSSAARARIDRLVTEGEDFADPRVDAVVLLAPGYGPLFSPDDLSEIETDALVIAASSDDLLPGDQVAALVDAMPEQTQSSEIDGGHYIFLRTCTSAELQAIPDLCTDDPSVDRESAHLQVGLMIEQFLDQ